MNMSQPQDSLRKKLKKLKKKPGKKLKKTKHKWGLDCYPSPLPARGKLSIWPPQSKNCSAVPDCDL